MAYSSYRNSNNIAPYYTELIADTLADIAKLPTSYAAGSTCLVIEDSSVWVIGNDLNWHKL